MIDLPLHKVSCPSCSRTYNVDLVLVPPQGARVTCRRCGARFAVHLPAMALPPESRLPVPSRRRVWVFPDDPAFQRPGVMTVLRTALEAYIFEVVDAETRTGLIQSAHEREEWPDVVVFGDMPVLLEDRLLRTVATRSNVFRVLVSTHHNPELVRVAEQYCGFDRHLALPLAPSDIREALTLEMP